MTQIPEPVQRDYPGPTCGELVGKGLVNYPCDQPRGHDGPHSSIDNPPSIAARIAWESAMAAEAAVAAPVAPPDVPAREPSGIFPGAAAQEAAAAAYPAGPEPSPEVYAAPQEATQPLSRPPASPAPAGSPGAFGPGVVRFGDDLRMIVRGLYDRTHHLAVKKAGTASDAAWMLQAVEVIRDVVDPGWRESATPPSG